MKIAFLLYPTAGIKVSEDTSFWIMHEMIRRGHAVYHFESRHLSWRAGSPHAALSRTRTDAKKGFLASPFAAESVDLAGFDCIFIRKEPPFDNDYLYTLQLLETIKSKVFILNDPAGIALSNEKLFILSFAPFIPETFVTDNASAARKFVLTLGKKAVVKPLDDKGGAGVFATHPRDENLPSLLEMATDGGAKKIMIQRFIPANRFGDKRILLLDGECIGAFTRRPPRHDFRANLHVGGTFHRATLTAREKKLVAALAGPLAERGLHFVGIDVIGDYLTEINVTSPSGIADLILLEKTHPEKKVADFIERKIGL